MWPTSTSLLSGARLQCLSPNLLLAKNVLHPATRPNRCPVARARGRTGSTTPSDGGQQEPKKRGRKPRTTAVEPVDADAAIPAAAEPPPPKKRGRKTKAEIEEATQAADQAFTALGHDIDEEDQAEAADEEGLAVAPAEGPGSWAEAAATTAGEEDRRRFPYHRRIHTAAQDGNISGAESAFTSMAAAGLPPGPRAYHVLLCAYLKAGDVAGGLDVTSRATDAGVQLLPESYAALIFSYMELNPPDVTVAKTLYSAMAGTDTPQQLPWSVLCRLLSAKGFAADTVATVREGLAGGLEMDPDVAEAYIKALCSTQQSDTALRFLEDMQSKYGFRPEARHVNYVVEAEARGGNLADAAGLMEASGIRGWGRNAGTFNGYLVGLVQRLRELENPNADDELVSSFATLRSRMVQSGVRPDKVTFKLEAEGFVELADARSAMSSITSMRNNAGSMGCRLLDPSSLARMLQLLCDRDMPVDLLQLLVYMSEDSCRLPPEALVPDSEGRTLLSRWVVEHMEGIAARAEARGVADSMLSSDIELVDGYRIGPGRCVIDEAGLIIPVSKCTMKELKAEAKARDIDGADKMKRPELVQQIKTARSRLPFNVLKAQVMRDETATKRKAKPAAAKKKRRPRVYRDVWTIDPESGDAAVAPAPRMYGEEDQYLLEGEQLEQIDVFDDQYGIKAFKDMQGVNFEAVMEARMLDDGAAAIMNVGDEDVATGFATLLPGAGDDEEDDLDDEDERQGKEGDGKNWEKMAAAADTELPGLQEGYQQLLMLQDKRLDTEEANLAAGMDIALDCVRAAEMLGGGCTAADVLALQKAALAERSTAAAVAVAERLKLLLQPGVVDGNGDPFSRQTVLRQYEELADMCLQLRSPVSADTVLEDAETAGLKPSDDILSRLTVALRGRPRRSVRLQRENAGLLERAGLDVTAEEDLQQLQEQPESSSSSGGSGSSTTTAQLPAPAAEPAVLDVEATAVTDQPVQQDGQSGAEEELGEEEVDDETMHVMEILTNIAEMNMQRETIGSTLEKTGLDRQQVLEILDDPVAILTDTSWLAQAVLQRPESLDRSIVPSSSTTAADDEAEEGEAEGEASLEDPEAAAAEDPEAAAAAAGEGEEGAEAEEDEEDGMTLLEIAHAAAEGSLTSEQNELLLSVAEQYQLPLMLDESTGQLIWPGTDEYEEWAAEGDNEALAQDDYLALGEAFESEFTDMAERAEKWAEVMMEHTVTEEGEEKELDTEEQEGLDELTSMFMEKMKSSGLFEVDEGSEEEAPSITVNKDALKNFNVDAELQKLAEEWGPMVEATRRQMEAEGILDELRDLGAPVEDLKLDTPRAGAASGTRLASSSSTSSI